MRLGIFEFTPSWIPSVITVLMLTLLVSLGIWQLERAATKAQLTGDFESGAQDAPIVIDGSLTHADGLRFRLAVAEGAYDGGHQFLLDNRTHNGIAGYHVLTPLHLSSGGMTVLVNRGWVPVGSSRQQLPELPVPEGQLRVRGSVKAPAGDPLLLGPAGYEINGWPRVVQRIDYSAMQRALGYALLPYVLLLEPVQPAGFVRDWKPYYGITPEKHRAYAFQWFALATALMTIYVVVNTRRRRRPTESERH